MSGVTSAAAEIEDDARRWRSIGDSRYEYVELFGTRWMARNGVLHLNSRDVGAVAPVLVKSLLKQVRRNNRSCSRNAGAREFDAHALQDCFDTAKGP